MAGGSLGSLTVDLVANIARFERALNKAEKLADKRAKGIKRTFIKMGTSIGAALTTFGFVKAVESSLEFADAIGKAADRAGVTTEKLQELRFAGDQLGITTQQLDDGMRRFTRRLGVALQGGSFAKDFDELGVSIRDVYNNVRSSEDVFDDVARQIANLGNAAEQSKVAAQLFGDDAGPQLALLLRQGEDGIRAFTDEAHRLGLIMDESTIRKAEAANDELSKLSQVIKIQLVEALVEAAPALEKAGRFLADFISGIGKAFGGLQAMDIEEVGNRIDLLQGKLASVRERIEELNRVETEGSWLDKVFNTDDIESLREKEQEQYDFLVAAFDRRDELLRERNRTGTIQDEGEPVNYFTQLTEEQMEEQLNQAIQAEQVLSQLVSEEAQKRIDVEQRYTDAVYAARSNAFSQGVGLLRKFAGENEAINAILISLQTAKAIKDIQIQGKAAQAQVLAYGMVEAAAHSAMFNYGAAAAALTRSYAAAASIEASTQLATAFAIASGAVDLAQIGSSGANADLGAPGNPITTTTVDSGTFAPNPVESTGGGGTITINVNGVITDEIMDDLVIPAIQDSVNDRDVILFRSDSRQALEL